MEENERRLLFYVAEKARLKNLANEVCEKFCEIISVRHLTCRNLFLRVGKEFYFGDKIPFFLLTCAAQEIFIRDFIRKLHDALYPTS